ncbi:MAG: histidine kinase [Bacteroidetes bacterium]|nr:histidine kinase [Bacteroidota bacterium]
MKQIITLILILNVAISFSQPAKTDPYFVASSDTISRFGPGSITRHILEDTKGNIWLASWQGIVRYDGKVFTNYTLKENLIPFHVYSLFEDRSGNVWFGTVRGGAYKYDGKTFTLFTTENGLADDLISCIMQDKKGNIWLATDGGASCLDTSAWHRTSVKGPFSLPVSTKKGVANYTADNGLSGNRVNSIIQDKSGKIWMGTRSGVSCYDGKSFTNFTINDSVPFTNVRCIKEDQRGRIWIGGQEGLYCYDPFATKETSLIKLMANFIGYVYEDKAGNFWFSAGETKGMALYKYDHKEFKKIIEKNMNGDSQVFEITEDKNNNIWFGTMRGPCRYDGTSFTYFTK